MSMDQFLAEHYGTANAATSTTFDKEAEASFDMFAKLAASEGIDLSAMSDADVASLYDQTMKTAGEDEEKDEEKEEDEKKKKEAAAQAELAAKTAAQGDAEVKIAEADYLGRVMAHAYVQEMKKIASEGVEPSEDEKIAGNLKAKFLENLGKGKDAVKSVAEKAGKHVGTGVTHAAGAAGKAKDLAQKHPKSTAGAAAGAAAAGGGAAFFASKKEKKASALDELAAERAMAKVAEAGWNVEEAAGLLGQLLTQGASDEGTKIASANGDLEGALEIRSLELLAQAGYPVSWA